MEYTGKVKWFTNGFGFITCEGFEKDIFVHYKNIKMDGFKNLNSGNVVKFEIQETPKGKQAVNVELVSKK